MRQETFQVKLRRGAKVYRWFKIFNRDEFLETGLVSRTFRLNLEGRGVEEFLVTRGDYVSIVFDGDIMPVEFANENPYRRGDKAVYVNDSKDVYIGFEL